HQRCAGNFRPAGRNAASHFLNVLFPFVRVPRGHVTRHTLTGPYLIASIFIGRLPKITSSAASLPAGHYPETRCRFLQRGHDIAESIRPRSYGPLERLHAPDCSDTNAG